MQLPLALDKSLRSVDADGHLRVEMCRVSKANICPYYGREIPNAQALGLDPDRMYRLFRDPKELAKGADTGTGKPLLIRHVPISADLPSKDSWVGTIGTCTFEDPYLVCRPLTVLTAEAIALIESEAQRELSAGYRYTADMTPGIWGGEAYDGVMRDLQFNHFALVSEGRAGPDVHVADEAPPELRAMPLKHAARIEALKPFLAKDADLIALDAEIDKEEKAQDEAEEKAEDEKNDCYGHAADEWEKMSAKDKKSARDKWAKDKAAKDKKAKDAKSAKDADPDHRDDFDGSKDSAITQAAMDAAIAAAVAPATAAAAELARKQTRELFIALEAVKPIVGVLAMDSVQSADEVYAFALKHAKVNINGVHPSAYPALLDVVKSRTAPVKSRDPSMAMDDKGNPITIADIFNLKSKAA